MSPLNTLIKSWKIQNVRPAKHASAFKVFFNKRNYAPVIIILIEWLFQRRMNILLFLRKKKTIAPMLNLLQMASVNKMQKLFILSSLEFGDLLINED